MEMYVAHKDQGCPLCSECKHMKCTVDYGYICDCAVDLVKGEAVDVYEARKHMCCVNGRYFQKFETYSNKSE